ncbi:MAG: Glycosyl transferase family 2, partial [Candidatus Levybacteria bacterium GW2011_GWB1_36_18]
MLSVVVPVYNEEEGIKAFFKELKKFLPQDYEVIFVDDGSTDKTLSLVKEIGSKNKNIRYFSLRRHQGKAEALTIGFQKSKGDFVLTIDADLQDRPDQI